MDSIEHLENMEEARADLLATILSVMLDRSSTLPLSEGLGDALKLGTMSLVQISRRIELFKRGI